MVQRPHAGLRAVHTYRPCRISQWCALRLNSRGVEALQSVLDRAGGLAASQPGPVRDPEDMGVDRDHRDPERGVQHHVRGLSSHSRQALQRCALARHRPSMALDEEPAGCGHVLRLGVEQADVADVLPARPPRQAPAWPRG